MAKTLTIQYVIPLSDEEWGGPTIRFYKWIPKGEDNLLTRERGNLISRLWIDEECIASLQPIDDEHISHWVNISVSKAYIAVQVSDVPDELASFIYDERDSPREIHHGVGLEHEEYEKLKGEYENLGGQVLREALTIFNRLVAFARNNKGQYWLHERPINLDAMSSLNTAFRAVVRSEDYNWVCWCPPRIDHFIIYSAGEETAINQYEWPRVQEFVVSDSRPSLVLELLANAQFLIDEGHRRSAIIEAASALEIALFAFAKSAKLDEITPSKTLSRFDAKQLHSQIEHIGFSGSVRFLLPLLFPSEILSDEILKRCQEVIEIRNNVVHRGQRDVDPQKIRPLVAAIRKACEIIIRYTG